MRIRKRWANDFGLFGLRLWHELESRYPGRCASWNRKLQILNTARKGIVHDDHPKLALAGAEGWPMTLRSVDRWRSALNGLARGMDHVVGEYLGGIIGAPPW